MESGEFKVKLSEFLAKNGVSNIMQIPSIRAKAAQTLYNRFGVLSPTSVDIFREKARATCLKRFGVDHFSKTREFQEMRSKKYYYDGETFDSSTELYFWIYIKYILHLDIKKCDLTYSYFDGEKNHTYFPDFIVENRVVEIKGDHFFDSNGVLINPYDRTKDYIAAAKQQCMKENNVKVVKMSDLFNATKIVNSKFSKDFINSCLIR